jgi:hypothetical protein
MITRTRITLTAFVAILLVGMLLISAPAFAVQIGNHDVTFDGYLNNYPSSGQSTWFYTVTSNSYGGGPAISHTTFALGECLTVVAAGTWSGSLPNPTLNQLYSGTNNSFVQVGTDPTTNVTGIKFDIGLSSGQTVYYYFTVTGAVGSGTNTVALKAGADFVSGPVGGPSCDETDPPLAVVLGDFWAVCEAATPLVSWTTLSETNTQGFNLYRGASADAWDTQVNAALIPSLSPGGTTGSTYEWLDTTATAGVTHYYWLQDVSLDGSTSEHGPISVQCDAPTAVRLIDLSVADSAAGTFQGLGWVALLAAVAVVGGLVGLQRRAKLD